MNFNCGILLLLAVVCNISLPIPLKMYVCYLCGDDVKLESINRLRFHLLRHKDNCELLLPIRCKQGQCMGTYTTVFNLLRHISTHHAVKSNILEHGADSYGSPDANSDATDCACMSCDDNDTDSDQNSRVNFLQEIETEAVSLLQVCVQIAVCRTVLSQQWWSLSTVCLPLWCHLCRLKWDVV